MRNRIARLASGGGITLAILLLATVARAATTNVFVDPSWPWNGFQNVYYQNGGFWTNAYFAPGATAALQASMDNAGTVICAPDIRMDRDYHFNTNAWADASGSSTGICNVVSTFYVDSTTLATAGDTVIFSGTFLSNTLAAPYSNSIIAFIKDFNSSWTSYGMVSVNLNTLTNGQRFSLSKTLAAPGAGNHVQCGLEWSGPPARTNTVASLGAAVLGPIPKPRGASVPWTTYEAEDMTNHGSTILGPQYLPNLVAAEASGRRAVQLNATGQNIEFAAPAQANSLVVRYCVPDTAGGGGADYTLSLYQNGAFLQKLPLTSKYSWLYGAYPFTNAPTAGSPRNFYDEVRVSGLTINSNDTIRLTKDADDAASYYIIDLVDLENVAAPLTQPANSLSISNYGAIADGVTDCTIAFRNCITAALSQGKTVWLPTGSYLITETVNLPTNVTIQGAGVWHTKLIGSSSLYNVTPSRRLNLNGTGNNIQLSDFAIVGFLNYRNDSEGNDGLGGSFGTGSSIARVWVEHTKAAAWILNSQGLVVDSCRFRNTLADGINLNLGMRSTIVTNCTARGTGDDAFAIWPAPGTPTYATGLNVITHCSAQVPFLANGGAIYGGESNRIEDCLFQDMPDGCGVLLSTTFPVSANFAGTTVVQRCDLNRCGGSRAGLEICLQNRGISGLNLNNLTITNSLTHGLRVTFGVGALANAILSNSTILNYGLAGSDGMHALHARDDAAGSLTVSNSSISEFMTDSRQFTFYFTPSPIPKILGLTLNGGTNLALTFTANPGDFYHVESATNLLPASWITVPGSATNAAWNLVALRTTVASSNSSRYYRVASP